MLIKQKNKIKNIFTAGIILLVVFFSFGPSAVPANAQWATISTTIGDIPRKIGDILSAVWKKNGSRAFQQAVRSVTYKFAQDTATWVAAGGKGQKPLLFSDPGKFFRESGDQVAGKFLVGLSEGLPLNLCSAADIKSKLAIEIGINQALLKRKNVSYYNTSGGCSLSSIKNNFATAVKAENFLIDVSATFEPGKSEISHGVRLWDDAKLAQDKFIAAELVRRSQAGDFKGVVDLINKYPNTPKEQVQAAIDEAQRQGLKQIPPKTEDIFIDTFAVFTNTLTKTYLQKLAGGYYPFKKTSGGPDVGDLAGAAGSVKALLASFDIFSPQRAATISTTGEIDLFSDMISCPPPQYQSPYNCLLNNGLRDAIQQGLTVGQALEKGYLDGNLPFPEVHDPTNPNLSLVNLKKLRFLRVLPVGWEIAAERLINQQTTKPLAHVIGCFDGENDGCGTGETSLIKLVDDEWVLALPQQYCRAEGFGNVPEFEKSANRQEWCVDLQSCIKEDSQGNCQSFGYCTRERAAWKLQGESCDKQYATCQVLRRPDGSTIGQGNTIGILGSDVNEAGCTQGSAGCTWFSTASSGTSWDASKRIYLTSLAPSCRAEDAGSREIIPLEPGTNLIRSSAATETVPVRQYAFYTLSFDFSGNNDLTAEVAGGGLTNVSFSESQSENQIERLLLNLSDEAPGRYAATFFNQGSDTVTVSFSSPAATRAQLEEVSFTDGQKAQAAVAANSDAGTRVLNYSTAATRNSASPATAYKPYQANRRLVFAGARECSPEEASARKYTALGGSESKIAQLSAGDLCPVACVGLNSYLAMPTSLETGVETAIKNFAAQYAKACPAAEAGCEEFTNLTAQTGGAEKRSYFSQVRSCVLDTNDNAATFYTWEGTDTAGFQLKSWRLLAEEGTGAPCNNFPQNSTRNSASAVCETVAPECVLNEVNPNCRVFLDESGREFKRDATKIVTAASDCSAFRRTRDGATWYLLARESKPCAAANIGCREYKGNRANLSTRILYSNFESQNHGWVRANGQSSVISSAAVVAGQTSLELSGKDSLAVADNLRANLADTFLINFIAKNESGGNITEISLSAGNPKADFNGDGQVNQLDFTAFTNAFNQSTSNAYAQYDIDKNGIVNFDDFLQFTSTYNTTTAPASFALGSTQISGTWQEYQFGPLSLTAGSGAPVYILSIASEGKVYIDNVELISSPAQFYITDSWAGKQPAACSAYNHCEAYTDDIRNTFYTSRFARLFGADSAYCRAVIDTQNSNSPLREEFNRDSGIDNPLDNFTVAADDLLYRIIKPENLRSAATAGCTALGVPKDTATSTPGWIGATYRIIDPDTFRSGSLCKAEALGCQNFTNDQGEAFTFRDPGKRLCSWNATNNQFVKINPETGQQTLESCYDGRAAGDPASWYVAQCPAEQSNCTAYAPVDSRYTEGASSALFVRKDTIEDSNCKAGDDINSGCLNFQENYFSGDIRKNLLVTPRQTLLAVKAGRQCAEWLAPTTTSEVKDPKSRSLRTVAYDLGRCQKLGPNGNCVYWTNQSQDNYPSAYLRSGAVEKLQVDIYANRQVGGKNLFSGAWDYSGYSIPNQYPLELFEEQKTGDNAFLAYNGEPIFARTELAALACRSFPEEDSPFASDGLDYNIQTGKFLYNESTKHMESLNKCEQGEACQCTYKKTVSSDGVSKYFNFATTKPFPNDTQSVTDLTGWQGYCAEWDEETRDPAGNPVCLVWWPVDVVRNGVNIFDNHPEAGFALSGPQYYCLAAQGNKLNNSFSYGLSSVDAAGKERLKGNSYLINMTDYAKNFDTVFSEGSDPGDGMALPFYPSETVGFDFGYTGASGIWKFNIKNGSQLRNLKEYDIEAIVVRASARQAGDWPAANEEFFLQRDGYAKSNVAAPDSGERWGAYWCGNGDGSAQCDFNNAYTWDKFKPYISGQGVLDPNAEGSVTVDRCNSSYIGKTNLFALRARFADAKGYAGDLGSGFVPYQFLGMEGGLCDASDKTGWIKFDIAFQLREWCSAVALVNNNGENKSWTGRLNQKSESSDIATGLFNASASPETLVVHSDGFGLNYKYNQDKAPFGAIVPPPATIHLPQTWDSRKDEEVPDATSNQTDIKILEPGKQPLYIETDRKQVRAGSAYSCPTGRCLIPPAETGAVIRQPDLGRAVNYLHQLFAKIYKVWIWNSSAVEYRENTALIPGAALDLNTATPRWLGECPVIAAGVAGGEANAVKEGDCRQAADWGAYAVDSQPIVNFRRSLNDNWVPIDSSIGEEVALQFYAYNRNGEQLPLRKIEIDWQDGVKTIISGSYKNHRPTCDNASQNYGQTNKACDPNIFEFKHAYTRVGSYIPSVTVWDNWGRFTVAAYSTNSRNKGVIVVGNPPLAGIAYNTNIAAGIDANPLPASLRGLPGITTESISALCSGQIGNGWCARFNRRNGERIMVPALIDNYRYEEFKVVDNLLNYSSNDLGPILPADWSGEYYGISWEGRINIPAAGTYAFELGVDDGADLSLDGQVVITNGGDHGLAYVASAPLYLSQGKHDIRVRMYNNGGPSNLVLKWRGPGQANFSLVPGSSVYLPATP